MPLEVLLRAIDDRSFVAGQISPGDVARIAARGIRLIVNNRPDDEEPGQPSSAAIEAAAREAGVDYLFLPVAGGVSERQIDVMASALEGASGPALAFCRSGTRSTFLWALARARLGDDGAELAEKAAAAGYDLAPIRGFLDRR
jgi:uncharacterized protein (TIGR01244 family)